MEGQETQACRPLLQDKGQARNIYLYRQDGIVTSIFTQSYSSDSFRSMGIKVLYLVPNGQKYSIYAEDYHQPVDDPFPVAPLLARVGADPGVVVADKSDFRIRLVSTDEPIPVSREKPKIRNPQRRHAGSCLRELPRDRPRNRPLRLSRAMRKPRGGTTRSPARGERSVARRRVCRGLSGISFGQEKRGSYGAP